MAGPCLQLLRHAAANGLRNSVVGAIEHIAVTAVAAYAIGRACPLCMNMCPPIGLRVSTAAARIVNVLP